MTTTPNSTDFSKKYIILNGTAINGVTGKKYKTYESKKGTYFICLGEKIYLTKP